MNLKKTTTWGSQKIDNGKCWKHTTNIINWDTAAPTFFYLCFFVTISLQCSHIVCLACCTLVPNCEARVVWSDLYYSAVN